MYVAWIEPRTDVDWNLLPPFCGASPMPLRLQSNKIACPLFTSFNPRWTKSVFTWSLMKHLHSEGWRFRALLYVFAWLNWRLLNLTLLAPLKATSKLTDPCIFYLNSCIIIDVHFQLLLLMLLLLLLFTLWYAWI